MAEQFTLFWHGPFSQWFGNDEDDMTVTQFVIEGREFNCAEKYMMWKKALLFGDQKIADQIMSEFLPRKIKALGREVRDFHIPTWRAVAKDIVMVGNFAKFSQNINLRTELFKTAGTTIVEASPYDKVWGIGMGAEHPDARDRSKWNGENWLGEVLTEVRNNLEYMRA